MCSWHRHVVLLLRLDGVRVCVCRVVCRDMWGTGGVVWCWCWRAVVGRVTRVFTWASADANPLAVGDIGKRNPE